MSLSGHSVALLFPAGFSYYRLVEPEFLLLEVASSLLRSPNEGMSGPNLGAEALGLQGG